MQTNTINSTYATMNRVAVRFKMNFVGIAQKDKQAQELHDVMSGK